MSLTTQYPKGAEWNKWDLHVHTPSSFIHHFQGNDPTNQWERFITDLEMLPPEFKVIGINDYLFIDGYRKVLEYRSKGRLQNINTILPVVEFRVKKFAGHKDFKRVNFHVIFSDSLNPDIIQNQFLNGLMGKYQLSPGLSGISWSGIITPDSLGDLGKAIKTSISPDRLLDYGTDLEEGFNNLNLNEDDILALLQTNSYLKNNYLTAIGKTEWASLSSNDQSIAEKKDIINKVDFVFISSESPEACRNAKLKLKEELVNHLLLDCSDAHYNSSEKQQKDKIGKCFTWIKSDPTFNGLKQIKYEPETRILIQDERPQEKTSYNVIDKVKFVGSSDSTYFNSNAIELNPNLNVIIGGKSSGKSLLLFHIAKAIDPIQVKEKLSVVNEKEYDLFSKVPEFDFKVRWEDGAINKLTDPDETKNRHITYIPQMYINHLAEQKGEKKLAELIENILSQNSNFKKFNEVQGKRIQDLNLKIGNDINELFSTRARAEAMIKEYRGIGDKKAIEDNINKIRKEITALNQKAGFSPDEVKLFTKLQKKKERVNSKKNKVDEYKERTNEYVQELVNLKNEVAERIEILPSQWFEITDALAQNFIDANIAQDIKESNEMFSHLIDKHSKLIQNFTKAIATKTFTLEQVNKALNPFNAKISNQQLLKRLETELIEDENKIKRLDEKDKQLIQIKEEGMKLKNDILKSIENLFDYYKQILEQIQSPELSVIGTGLYLQTDLEIDKNAFQNGFCGLLDGRSNFNTLFGNCFDMSNNYVYSKESHVENIKSIF